MVSANLLQFPDQNPRVTTMFGRLQQHKATFGGDRELMNTVAFNGGERKEAIRDRFELRNLLSKSALRMELKQ